MLSINKDFKEKQIKWINPRHNEEYDEVVVQSKIPQGEYPDHVHTMLAFLKNRNNYITEMGKGKNMTVTPFSAKKISNTDAGRKPTIYTFNRDKRERVIAQMNSGKPVVKPIILYDTRTKHMHLLAGNTRLTLNTYFGTKITPVFAITYDSKKMENKQ